MKKLYMQGGGNSDRYTAPTIETTDVSVEKGFAESLNFGEEGFPGGNFEDTDFGSF